MFERIKISQHCVGLLQQISAILYTLLTKVQHKFNILSFHSFYFTHKRKMPKLVDNDNCPLQRCLHRIDLCRDPLVVSVHFIFSLSFFERCSRSITYRCISVRPCLPPSLPAWLPACPAPCEACATASGHWPGGAVSSLRVKPLCESPCNLPSELLHGLHRSVLS